MHAAGKRRLNRPAQLPSTQRLHHVRLYQKLLHLHFVCRPRGTLFPHLGGRQPETFLPKKPTRALHHVARGVPDLPRWLNDPVSSTLLMCARAGAGKREGNAVGGRLQGRLGRLFVPPKPGRGLLFFFSFIFASCFPPAKDEEEEKKKGERSRGLRNQNKPVDITRGAEMRGRLREQYYPRYSRSNPRRIG